MPAVLRCPGSVTGVRGGWRESRSGRAAGERAVQARRRGRAQRCTPGRLWGPALFAQLSGSRSLGQSRVTLALAATIRRNPAVSQWLSVPWISFGKILVLKINFVSREELESFVATKETFASSPAIRLNRNFSRFACDPEVWSQLFLTVKLVLCEG